MELQGKTIAFLGDSITAGSGVIEIRNRYDNKLMEMLELREVYNYGIGGTRIARKRIPSEDPRHDLCFCDRAYDIDKKVDLIVVYGGVNDWIHGDAPFGKSSDKTPATFCGAVNYLMGLLNEEYSNAKKIFIAPGHAFYVGLSDKQVSGLPMKTADSKPLLEYVRMIEKAGGIYKIPVLNLYMKLGIDPNVEDDYKKYTVDGLHYNDAGHAKLANCIASFIKDL